MSSSGVARTIPFLRTRIRPPCSTMNVRPVPSRALVMQDRALEAGHDRRRARCRRRSSARRHWPSVVGRGSRGAAAAGAGNSATSSAAPARATRRRPAAAGAGRDIGTPWARRRRVAVDRILPGRAARCVPVDPARPRTYPRAMTSGTTDPVSISRRWGAQSMTAPLREVLVKAPGPAFGGAFHHHGAGFLHPVDLDAARREHDGLVELLDRLGVIVHRLDAETDDPDLVYVFDPLLDRRWRRDPAAARQAQPGRRARRPRGVDPRARHPDAGADRGAGHARGRRHVLAPPGPAVHRADAADQRRRRAAACRARRRRRPDLRRPVLARAGRARPPAVGDLARRGRRRGRVPAAAADGPLRPPPRPRRSGSSRCPRRSTPRWAATSSRCGPGSSSPPTATTRRGARLEAAGVEVHAIPLARGRRERLGRRHLPHAAGAPGVSGRRSRSAAPAAALRDEARAAAAAVDA